MGLCLDVRQEQFRPLTNVAEAGVRCCLVLEFKMEPQRQWRASDEENTGLGGERTLDSGIRQESVQVPNDRQALVWHRYLTGYVPIECAHFNSH